MRLKLTLPQDKFDSLAGKLNEWKTVILSKDESGTQLSVVSLRSTSLEIYNISSVFSRSLIEFVYFIFL